VTSISPSKLISLPVKVTCGLVVVVMFVVGSALRRAQYTVIPCKLTSIFRNKIENSSLAFMYQWFFV
jgi:hypothetical protein